MLAISLASLDTSLAEETVQLAPPVVPLVPLRVQLAVCLALQPGVS